MGTFIDLVEGKEKMTVKIAGVPVAEIIGMLLGGAVMVAGYCVADGFFAGNMAAGFLGVPANIGQFVVGMVLASSLAAALYKTPVKRYFVHKIDEV